MSPAAVQPRDGTTGAELNGGRSSEPEANAVETTNGGSGRDSPSGCEHEHFTMKIVDETYSLDVDEVFTLLFTDSHLFREFIKRRRTYDVRLADWPKEFDDEGKKVRQIYYTLSINYSIGPKFSPSSERQILLPESQPGRRYLVDAECVNGGVPYSDHFYTLIRYCITRPEPSLTRLVITGQVMYLKSVFGFIKGLLQKTAVSGLAESFGVIAELLRQESDRRLLRKAPSSSSSSTAARPTSLPLRGTHAGGDRSQPPGSASSPSATTTTAGEAACVPPSRRRRQSGSGGNQRRQKASATNAVTDDDLSGKATGRYGSKPETVGSFVPKDFNVLYLPVDHMELLIALLFIVVLALVFVNAALYYQLSALESTLVRTFVHQRDDRSFS